jgi:hypothetical protein
VACAKLTNLRLDKDGIGKLVNGKMKGNHSVLLSRYPQYTSWPADAQLALHSISWAWGPAFSSVWGENGKQFDAALNQTKPDFVKAGEIMHAASLHEESINGGIKPRDVANIKLFANAADAWAKKANFDTLWYPGIVTAIAVGIGGIVTLGVVGLASFFGYENYKKTGKVLPW